MINKDNRKFWIIDDGSGKYYNGFYAAGITENDKKISDYKSSVFSFTIGVSSQPNILRMLLSIISRIEKFIFDKEKNSTAFYQKDF